MPRIQAPQSPHRAEQGSPREVLKHSDTWKTAPHAAPERLQQRDAAVARFRDLVAAHHGSTAKLFKAVKKTKEDMLDAEVRLFGPPGSAVFRPVGTHFQAHQPPILPAGQEFENLMLRLNLGALFPPAQQQLLLEVRG